MAIFNGKLLVYQRVIHDTTTKIRLFPQAHVFSLNSEDLATKSTSITLCPILVMGNFTHRGTEQTWERVCYQKDTSALARVSGTGIRAEDHHQAANVKV